MYMCLKFNIKYEIPTKANAVFACFSLLIPLRYRLTLGAGVGEYNSVN